MRLLERLQWPVAVFVSGTLALGPQVLLAQIDVQLLEREAPTGPEASRLALARARVALLDARDAIDTALLEVERAMSRVEEDALELRHEAERARALTAEDAARESAVAQEEFRQHLARWGGWRDEAHRRLTRVAAHVRQSIERWGPALERFLVARPAARAVSDPLPWEALPAASRSPEGASPLELLLPVVLPTAGAETVELPVFQARAVGVSTLTAEAADESETDETDDADEPATPVGVARLPRVTGGAEPCPYGDESIVETLSRIDGTLFAPLPGVPQVTAEHGELFYGEEGSSDPEDVEAPPARFLAPRREEFRPGALDRDPAH